MTDKPPNILVGTPAYNGQVHVDYVQSLMEFYARRIRFHVSTLANESLITRARNAILSQFHAQKQFTHLLFLDGDVYLRGEDLQRLIDHGRDAIGAPVPLKGFDAHGQRLLNHGPPLERVGELARVDRVGTAVLLLSRRAVDALVRDAIADHRTYHNRVPDQGDGALPEIQYDVFRVGVVAGEYLSEDFWVCRRLRALGHEVFIDPGIRVRHNGMHAFE